MLAFFGVGVTTSSCSSNPASAPHYCNSDSECGTGMVCGALVFPVTECFSRNGGNKLICRTEGGRRPTQ